MHDEEKETARRHLYRKYRAFMRWEIDAAIDFAEAERNHDYIPLLLAYGAFYRGQTPPVVYTTGTTHNADVTITRLP